MKSLVLGLYAVTPLHPGSGSEISVIDLPIQRERHTGFPVIWGQSLKGVLRSAFGDYELESREESGQKLREIIKAELLEIEKKLKSDIPEEEVKELITRKTELENLLLSPPMTTAIFGPPTNRASEHAGAIAVGDAKILLFPVRSANGVFAYVTSPMVLERFKRDLQLAGRNADFEVPAVGKGKALVTGNSDVENNGRVILEELVLDVEDRVDEKVIDAIKLVLPEGIDVSRRIVIVDDDVFSTFVRLSTEIVARVAIDASKGTVKQGGLWYEEFLPSDTLLYSVIIVGNPRGGALKSEEEVEETLRGFITDTRYLQVGGDETVGKGFVLAKPG
ncbi:type III-B CRISPR module RAMP protein Cmr4 [Thermococcus indicus]|uniref:Type III-B CRISPR module RAMP protein Cmr4 n=1 Tax=Thermococcus indicus TaxID=2586643 RepID=A0A4Y5SMU2_9EURY|nr:type III-B CRISPR module RAMP protein Cmr4 [Thermococcus indicus]QDA31654.1 type III-B CRISPR module RAMP protein Cmr4 [Thermococcus indicus]